MERRFDCDSSSDPSLVRVSVGVEDVEVLSCIPNLITHADQLPGSQNRLAQGLPTAVYGTYYCFHSKLPLFILF
jgi:hypothetical protein